MRVLNLQQHYCHSAPIEGAGRSLRVRACVCVCHCVCRAVMVVGSRAALTGLEQKGLGGKPRPAVLALMGIRNDRRCPPGSDKTSGFETQIVKMDGRGRRTPVCSPGEKNQTHHRSSGRKTLGNSENCRVVTCHSVNISGGADEEETDERRWGASATPSSEKPVDALKSRLHESSNDSWPNHIGQMNLGSH